MIITMMCKQCVCICSWQKCAPKPKYLCNETLSHTDQKKYFSTMKNVDYSSLHKVVFEQNLSTLFLVISFHTVRIDRERERIGGKLWWNSCGSSFCIVHYRRQNMCMPHGYIVSMIQYNVVIDFIIGNWIGSCMSTKSQVRLIETGERAYIEKYNVSYHILGVECERI